MQLIFGTEYIATSLMVQGKLKYNYLLLYFKQYNIYNGYMRHMARSELDICVLGPSSWYRADGNIFNKILPNLNPFYFNNPKKNKMAFNFSIFSPELDFIQITEY